MADAASVAQLIAAYLAEVEQVMAKAKPTDGILGMSPGPQHDPCHERFDAQIAEAVQQLAASNPSGAKAEEAVDALLRAEQQYACPECARWMLVAVQRHALPLLSFVSPAYAQSACTWYSKAYPLFRRFPSQKEVLKALKEKSK